LHYFFKGLDAAAFERKLQEWLLAHYADKMTNCLHMDGKTLCGSRKGEIPGVHLLAAYSDKLGTAVLEIPVDAKTNEHKAALELLHLLPLNGVLVNRSNSPTNCHNTLRTLCSAIIRLAQQGCLC